MAPERRAYPTAPTLTRPSYARPGTPRRSGTTHTPPPIPATVWTWPPATPQPTGAATHAETWAAATTAAIVAAFSEPHGRVGILPWPNAIHLLDPGHLLSATEGARGESGPATATAPAAEEVIAAIIDQQRTPVLLDFPTVPVDAHFERVPSSRREPRPLQAPTSFAAEPEGLPTSREAAAAGQRSGSGSEPVAPLDLIISSVAPVLVDDASAASVALTSGRALRLGGVLAVLTHSHQVEGRLVDPGGLLVSAAQNADLLYLQHIIVLHTPTSEPLAAPGPHSEGGEAPGRPWPARHRRTHADLYVFGQPHDHHTPDGGPLLGAAAAGDPVSTPTIGGSR